MKKNIALIIAGGSGQRMGQSVPKQFLTINEKPVLIYTLENFQSNRNVDEILVVCIDGWQDALALYAEKYGITKLTRIVTGGETAQQSIFSGVKALYGKYDDDSCIIVHDGIRPLVDESVLNDVIEKCHKYGNGVTSMPYNEQICVKKDATCTDTYIPRETLMRVSTPQAYLLGTLYKRYTQAFSENIGLSESSYVNTMMIELGETLYFAKGSDKNIKLTTMDDFAVFEALLALKGLRNNEEN